MVDLQTKGCYSTKTQLIWYKFCKALIHNECSIILSKFITFGLFILILGKSAIMDQTACCYDVTTWSIDRSQNAKSW